MSKPKTLADILHRTKFRMRVVDAEKRERQSFTERTAKYGRYIGHLTLEILYTIDGMPTDFAGLRVHYHYAVGTWMVDAMARAKGLPEDLDKIKDTIGMYFNGMIVRVADPREIPTGDPEIDKNMPTFIRVDLFRTVQPK